MRPLGGAGTLATIGKAKAESEPEAEVDGADPETRSPIAGTQVHAGALAASISLQPADSATCTVLRASRPGARASS
jgi:hypothetical protein